ncbi:hypothetical protein DMS87_24825 [Klebsiella variicola]|nr:hypothetical protein DMS44_22195 [Klebsiella variicola]PXL06454.1 hypothetical protein DMS46_25200 [Klebsiella variicola]PXL52188.1 hypothetical protein DMS45_22945 [Klebsiella variicola]PXM46516.1 hypothetical protein DMS87_24825 [Klebsiella variicola]HBX9987861.1 hypothetical protein [Klebsiella variicola]
MFRHRRFHGLLGIRSADMEGNSLIFNSEIIRDWSGFANPNCHQVLVQQTSGLRISVKIYQQGLIYPIVFACFLGLLLIKSSGISHLRCSYSLIYSGIGYQQPDG